MVNDQHQPNNFKCISGYVVQVSPTKTAHGVGRKGLKHYRMLRNLSLEFLYLCTLFMQVITSVSSILFQDNHIHNNIMFLPSIKH